MVYELLPCSNTVYKEQAPPFYASCQPFQLLTWKFPFSVSRTLDQSLSACAVCRHKHTHVFAPVMYIQMDLKYNITVQKWETSNGIYTPCRDVTVALNKMSLDKWPCQVHAQVSWHYEVNIILFCIIFALLGMLMETMLFSFFVFDVLLTVHLSIILVINQLLMHKFLFYNKFIKRLYIFRALCAHHQEVKIVLYSVWYHHTCRWPSCAQVERGLFSQPVHRTAT